MNYQETPCYCIGIRKVSRNLMSMYDRYLKPVALTVSQFSILYNLQKQGICNVSELAEQTGLERTSLVRMLKPLYRKEFVEDQSGGKGRSRQLCLTDCGRRKLDEAEPYWQQAQKEIEDLIGKEQMIAVLNQLEKLMP